MEVALSENPPEAVADQADNSRELHELSRERSSSSIVFPPRLTRTGSLVLKNFKKWQETPNFNGIVYRFLPMKLPFDGLADPPHDIQTIAAAWPTVRLIIDLQNQDDKYEVDGLNIRHIRVRMESKAFPTLDEVRAFQQVADAFFREDETGLAGVHCHYGYNRTGFQICSYLIERLNYSVQEAIDKFAETRPPGIRHQHYKDELHRRYGAGQRVLSDVRT